MLKLDLFNIICIVINLLVLYIALRLVFFKPIQKILEERQAMVQKDFDDAARAKADAEAAEAQSKSVRDSLEASRELEMSLAQQRAAAEYTRIVDSAKAEAEEIVRDAAASAQRERQEILRQAQAELTDMVVTAAAKVTGTPASDQALYDEFLKKAKDN